MRSLIPATTLVVLSFALAWAVFLKGGVWPDDWCVSLALIGLASCLFWLFLPAGTRPRNPLNVWIRWLLVALPAYVALTLIPLPSRLLNILSPARGTLLHQLQPVLPTVRFAPLTVNPPATVLYLFTVIGYLAVFLLIREIALSLPLWATAIPLLLIAVFEAVLGLVQSNAGNPSVVATGTYTNRDHFAGLLEMVLPFAVLFGLASLREKLHGANPTKSLVLACTSWGIAALLFAAILYSLSRMGLIVALFVLFLVAVLSFGKHLRLRRSKWLMTAGVSAAIVLLSVLIIPDQLAGRFAALSSKDAAAEIRSALWRETLPVISEFRFFGCGLGGFESVFLKHQAVATDHAVEFAHNDYLQYLAELGVLGFILLAATLTLIARDIVGGLFLDLRQRDRLLLIACAAACAGMALHSFVDFNTYIPANAMTLAWVAGIASGVIASATARE